MFSALLLHSLLMGLPNPTDASLLEELGDAPAEFVSLNPDVELLEDLDEPVVFVVSARSLEDAALLEEDIGEYQAPVDPWLPPTDDELLEDL